MESKLLKSMVCLLVDFVTKDDAIDVQRFVGIINDIAKLFSKRSKDADDMKHGLFFEDEPITFVDQDVNGWTPDVDVDRIEQRVNIGDDLYFYYENFLDRLPGYDVSVISSFVGEAGDLVRLRFWKVTSDYVPGTLGVDLDEVINVIIVSDADGVRDVIGPVVDIRRLKEADTDVERFEFAQNLRGTCVWHSFALPDSGKLRQWKVDLDGFNKVGENG